MWRYSYNYKQTAVAFGFARRNKKWLSTLLAEQKERPKSIQLPTVHLPQLLQKSLDKILSNYSRKSLIADGVLLSRHLGKRQPMVLSEPRRSTGPAINWDNERLTTIDAPIRYGKRESTAFAASRTQACYGTALRVLNEIARIDPDFKPETMLDFGSGLGTVSWAANEIWNESLYEYQTVDVSEEMGTLAHMLRRDGEEPSSSLPDPQDCIPGVYFKRYLSLSVKVGVAKETTNPMQTRYDLVVAAYSLSELSSVNKMKQILESLWNKTSQYIVLIEQGNQRGFDIISKSRDYLLQATRFDADDHESVNSHVVCPCPHDLDCPVHMQGMYPCRFAQNVRLSLAQVNSSLRHKGVYTEHFSYIVIKKDVRPTQNDIIPSRLLLPVKKRTRHVICSVCCPNGKACEVILTKTKDKDIYKQVRKMKWGDVVLLKADKYEQKREKNNNNNNINSQINIINDIVNDNNDTACANDNNDTACANSSIDNNY